MRRNGLLKRVVLSFLVFGLTLAPAADWGWALMCQVDAPPVLSITDDVGPFTLSFPDFAGGSLSTVQVVVYRVQANNMAPGSIQGAVTAHLDSLFGDAELRADVTGYANLGDPEFSTLSEAQGGFVTVQTTPVQLADKQPGDVCCDPCMDGTLTVLWQARLTGDAAAGSTTRTLTVTLRDGF